MTKFKTNKNKAFAFLGAVFVLLIALMFTACSNGAGGNTGSGGGGSSGGGSGGGTTAPAINPDEQWVNETVNKADVSPTLIVGTGKTITLSGDDLTWSSDKTGIISVTNAPSGPYTVTPPEGSAEVTLTAKAERGGFSKQRTFTVAVHKETTTLSAAGLIKSLNLPAETESNITLPTTIAGASGSSITWASDNPALIGTGGNIDREQRDLRNKTVKLTATLTYNGEQAQKEFTVALKRITKIEQIHTHGSESDTDTWLFSDNIMEHISSHTKDSVTRKNGKRYLYKDIDTDAKTFTAHRTHDMIDEKWYEIGSYAHQAAFMEGVPQEEYEELLDAYRAYVNNHKTPKSYTYQIRYDSYNQIYHFAATVNYDASKKWFEQDGYYEWHSPPPPPNEYIAFMYKGDRKYSFSYKNKRYYGSLNPEGTVFTGREKDPGSESITVNITDKHNGTVDITVQGQTHTLSFHGSGL